MTYSLWLEQWMNTYVHPRLAQSTASRYDCTIKTMHKYLPNLMETEVSQITNFMLQNALNSLPNQFSKSQVKKVRSLFSLSMRAALQNNMIASFPSSGLSLPRNAPEKKVDSLTANEQARLEAAASKDPLGHIVIFFLYTGLRSSELLDLRWRDVDLRHGWIQVRKSKTEAGIRQVPLTSKMTALLRELPNFQASADAHVFQTMTNTAISKAALIRLYRRMQEAADLPNLTTHVYRHTFATRAVEKGIDINALSKILGHTDPAFTARRYVHPDNNYLRNELLKIFE